MLLGYSYILLAAIGWGLSATWARYLIVNEYATPLLLSQSRVMFAWLILAAFTAFWNRRSFRISPKDIPRFLVLGIVGIAGANYFLYHAIGSMNAALADLIQFTAPIIVVVWMWAMRQEGLSKAKLSALMLSVIGCALALNVTSLHTSQPLSAVASAGLSALCFATVLILGKAVSRKYSVLTYLNYALLSATMFWLVVVPPLTTTQQVTDPTKLLILVIFSVTSILLPYTFFFLGLARVPASRAGIVSTFEPVVVAIGSWLFLSEALAGVQILGIVLVCAAIIIVELSTGRGDETAQAESSQVPK